MTSYKPVTAALRVLEVLSAVNRCHGRASVGELHRQTGIDKSTIVRMLETLMSAGFVARDADTALYRVTGKTLMLSASFDRHKEFGDILAPLLAAFREEIGWPSDIALYDSGEMLVIESSRQGGALSFKRSAGFRAPMLATSLGLAYLAHCSVESQVEAIAAAATDPAPWNDLARDPARLDALLDAIRAAGFATMNADYSAREYGNRIQSIGVPIMAGERIYATINVIYLKQALSARNAAKTLLPQLKTIAGRMADALQRRSAER